MHNVRFNHLQQRYFPETLSVHESKTVNKGEENSLINLYERKNSRKVICYKQNSYHYVCIYYHIQVKWYVFDHHLYIHETQCNILFYIYFIDWFTHVAAQKLISMQKPCRKFINVTDNLYLLAKERVFLWVL